jgi:hypothetical protein
MVIFLVAGIVSIIALIMGLDALIYLEAKKS